MKRKKRKYTKEEIEKARKSGQSGDKILREKLGKEEYIRTKRRAGLKGLIKRWKTKIIEQYD